MTSSARSAGSVRSGRQDGGVTSSTGTTGAAGPVLAGTVPADTVPADTVPADTVPADTVPAGSCSARHGAMVGAAARISRTEQPTSRSRRTTVFRPYTTPATLSG